MTAMADEVPITELEKIEADRIDGVGMPANGIPVLLLKAVPAPEEAVKADGMTHPPFTGTHSHPHAANGAQGEDGSHEHEHSHDGDADHGHSHAEKSAGLPEWHAAAVQLAKFALAAPSLPRETLFKAVVNGAVDEQPDIDGGKQAIALIAKLIGYEAQELEAGCLDEIWDIQTLCCAADALQCWLGREQAAQAGADAYGMDGADGADGMLMQSAWEYPADEVAKDSREFTAAERKKHAAEGNALPDGSYPIPDADALGRAAILARSKHGDWKAARRLIARRARELGVKNPLDDDGDTSKSQIAPEGTDVDTVTQGTDGQIAKAVEDAIAKATAPLKERIESLGEELAKVKALPVPGGPMMAAVPRAKAPDGEDHAAKAAYYDRMAGSLASPQDADTYRQLAAQERAKITAS